MFAALKDSSLVRHKNTAHDLLIIILLYICVSVVNFSRSLQNHLSSNYLDSVWLKYTTLLTDV